MYAGLFHGKRPRTERPDRADTVVRPDSSRAGGMK